MPLICNFLENESFRTQTPLQNTKKHFFFKVVHLACRCQIAKLYDLAWFPNQGLGCGPLTRWQLHELTSWSHKTLQLKRSRGMLKRLLQRLARQQPESPPPLMQDNSLKQGTDLNKMVFDRACMCIKVPGYQAPICFYTGARRLLYVFSNAFRTVHTILFHKNANISPWSVYLPRAQNLGSQSVDIDHRHTRIGDAFSYLAAFKKKYVLLPRSPVPDHSSPTRPVSTEQASLNMGLHHNMIQTNSERDLRSTFCDRDGLVTYVAALTNVPR